MTEATDNVIEREAEDIIADLDAKDCGPAGHSSVVRAQKFTIRHCIAVRKDIGELSKAVSLLPAEVAKQVAKTNGYGNGNSRRTLTLPGGAKVQFADKDSLRDINRLILLISVFYLIYLIGSNKIAIGNIAHESNLALSRTASVSQPASGEARTP